MPRQVIGVPFKGPDGQPMPFPKAVRAGDFVFVSGQMATDRDGAFAGTTIEVQTRAVLDSIAEILIEAGSGLEDVVKCTCFITDGRDFQRFNAVWLEYFPSEQPARTTVVAKLVMEAKLEIEAIAYRPSNRSGRAQSSAGARSEGEYG